jgi:hypothetical protein
VTVLVPLAACVAGLMLGAAGLALFYRRREASWPTTWTEVGSPPVASARALRILDALAPAPVRSGGTVEWVDGPFASFGLTVAGVMVSALPIRVKVARWERVEQTALAHEIGHAFWTQLYGTDGEGDVRFLAWVTRANAVLSAALEGAR